MTNVLFVGRSFFYGGGAATRIISIIDSLTQKNKVFVLTIVPKEEQAKSTNSKNLQVFNCPIQRRFTIIPFLSIVNVFLTFFYVHRMLRKIKVDAAVVSVPEFEEGIGAAIALKSKVPRTIIDVGDLIVDDHVAAAYYMFPELMRKAFRYILRTSFVRAINSFDESVTVTSTLRDAMIEEGINIPIHVIENGADTTLFHPLTPAAKLKTREKLGLNGDFLLLYAGSMCADYYPMEVIFNAFEITKKSFPDAKLILCGPWNAQVENLAANLGSSVKYLGFLKLSDMAKVMQVCDIGLITMDRRPSTLVALTTKFFEYIASGVPVVAAIPRGGELDKLINATQVGYSVDSGDYEAMAKKLIDLLTNAGKYRVFAENGVKLVSERFDRAKLADAFQNILLQTNN